MASRQVYKGEREVDITWGGQLHFVSPELILATWEPKGNPGCRAALGEAKQAGELAGTVCVMFMVFLGQGREERWENCLTAVQETVK